MQKEAMTLTQTAFHCYDLVEPLDTRAGAVRSGTPTIIRSLCLHLIKETSDHSEHAIAKLSLCSHVSSVRLLAQLSDQELHSLVYTTRNSMLS